MKRTADTNEDDTETDYNEFSRVLKANCSFKHPGDKLPKIPWFLKSCRDEKVAVFLTQLLYDSKFMTKDFIDKATLLLLLHRTENENHCMKMASLLKENIDIREKLKIIEEDTQKSRGEICFLEGESGFGSLSITVEMDGEVRNLDVGESIEGNISLKSDIEVLVFADTGEEQVKLDEIFVFFGAAVEDIYYLSLVEKNIFTTVISKGDERYKLRLEVAISLSNSEKREILLQHLYENEGLSQQEQESEGIYEKLLSQLGITIEDGQVKSTLIKKVSRDCCCLIH